MRVYYDYLEGGAISGGKKQMRLHALLLREMGLEAFILRGREWHDSRNRHDDASVYDLEVPIAPFPLDQAKRLLDPSDVIILTEINLHERLKQLEGWDVRIGLFNQNGFNLIRDRPRRSRYRHRIEFALAIAPYVAAVTHRVLSMPWERIFTIPPWILRGPVTISTPTWNGTPAVSYMPRKLPAIARMVRASIEKSHPDLSWIEIDGVSEAEAISMVKRSHVFLSTQCREGCPAPALEAMSGGVVVAGFPGTAGFPHPYADPSNGMWATDGSVEEAISALDKAIDLVRRGGEPLRRMRSSGHETARQFGRDRIDATLRDLVQSLRSRDYSRRAPGLVRLNGAGRWQLIREMHDWNRYRRLAKRWMRGIRGKSA